MKIHIEIDLSAQEARDFLGLPDVRPLQQEMLQSLSDGMRSGSAGFDALSLMKPLFPAQMQSLEGVQKAFWEAFQQTEPGDAGTDGAKAEPEAGKKTAGAKKKPARRR